jgi:hypothetical protein
MAEIGRQLPGGINKSNISIFDLLRDKHVLPEILQKATWKPTWSVAKVK